VGEGPTLPKPKRIIMDYPQRKNTRLKEYDYSQQGAYFITICVRNKCELLGRIIVGAGFHARPDCELTELGEEVEKVIENIQSIEQGVEIHKYSIMPNHVHMIVFLSMNDKDIQSVVGRVKSYTTRRWNEINGWAGGHGNPPLRSFWQRSYHDHIIRDEKDYQRIWQYIDENPVKWAEDCYFV